ncbi:SWR1-complex protein 5 [Erysiphe neolycopersici]|uniref:SWR1-complex protein 5 n=1 Tax=Erysiphe neolycopersici TaxID=212602 RepID=A0A420I496_9PEZI|nr:SWR1-complex protein 5 [Erysiphe neolycopersici]
MPPITTLSEDGYNSSEDSDFAPEKTDTNHDDVSSDSDSDSENSFTKKRKRVSNIHSTCLDTYDSGDEKIISVSNSAKKARFQNVSVDRNGDGGDAEGFVKTRSQHSKEREKDYEKQIIDKSAITIDVDAVWEAMKLGKPLPNSYETSPTKSQSHPKDNLQDDTSQQVKILSHSQAQVCPRDKNNDEGPDSMIKIKRTYKFAGKFHTEEKFVARGSAEAKLHLKSLSDTSGANLHESALSDHISKFKRPPKLARTSIFEPISKNTPQRSDLHLGVRRETSLLASDILKDGKKLNTVEKSAMDWASFVDKEGIADELDAASKSKDAYKARQEFLARVEQKKEDNTRKARGFIS